MNRRLHLGLAALLVLATSCSDGDGDALDPGARNAAASMNITLGEPEPTTLYGYPGDGARRRFLELLDGPAGGGLTAAWVLEARRSIALAQWGFLIDDAQPLRSPSLGVTGAVAGCTRRTGPYVEFSCRTIDGDPLDLEGWAALSPGWLRWELSATPRGVQGRFDGDRGNVHFSDAGIRGWLDAEHWRDDPRVDSWSESLDFDLVFDAGALANLRANMRSDGCLGPVAGGFVEYRILNEGLYAGHAFAVRQTWSSCSVGQYRRGQALPPPP